MEEVREAWQSVISLHELAQLNWELAIAYLDDAEAALHTSREKLAEVRDSIHELRGDDDDTRVGRV